MIHTIQTHIKELAEEKNLKVLMAIESGSRAWGFPSPDSDYDVRMIYIREPSWYLSINQKKDSIDYFHGELLDINGWDIRKALSLLRKSNATPFEWAQSPIVYQEVNGFREKLLDLAQQFFQPQHTVNHYMGIAYNSYKSNISGSQIKLKKLFYILRPVLAAKWIINSQTIPPMDIWGLLPMLENSAIEQEIRDLIALKENANEDYVHEVSNSLLAFIAHSFEELGATRLPKREDLPDVEVLNSFYRDLLGLSI